MLQHCIVIASFFLQIVVLFAPTRANAHCDTMEGPVIKAARKALETGNVNLVLIWVQPTDESTIREAFQKTLATRKLNAQARELADMYFFETLVRIHRAGEGEPYTGLKPSVSETEPGIDAADAAIESGSIDEMVKALTEKMRAGIVEKFKEINRTKEYAADDPEGGRRYVREYVGFIHYVERLYESLSPAEEGHHGAEAKDN